MNKNKTIIITIVSGLLVAIIAGFIVSFINIQNRATSTPTDVTLNMVGFTYSAAQLQPILSDYTAVHPHIHINYTQIDETTYKTYLTDRMKGGNTKVIPDIFEAKSTDQNTFITFTRTANTSVISPATFTSTYYPLFSRGLIYNKQSVIGLPNTINPLFLIYNKSLLQSQSINPIDVTNDIDSFNRLTTQIAKSGKIASVNIGMTSTHFSDILQLFLIENGANMNSTSDPFKAAFNDTRGAQVVEYFQSFVSGIHKDNWDSLKSENDVNTFIKGSTAFLFGTIEDVMNIHALQPSLSLGYGMYPSLNTPVTLASYTYDAVYGYSSYPNESWDLLMYLHSKDVQQKLNTIVAANNQYGIISPRKDLPFINTDKGLATIVNTAAGDSTDWNTEDEQLTAQVFKTLLSNYSTGAPGQGALDVAVKQINTNIQKALNL